MNKKSGLPGLDGGKSYSTACMHVSLAKEIASLPADFIVWLASPEASFAKGKYLFVDWDVEELVERSQEISENGGLLEMWIEGLEHKAAR